MQMHSMRIKQVTLPLLALTRTAYTMIAAYLALHALLHIMHVWQYVVSDLVFNNGYSLAMMSAPLLPGGVLLILGTYTCLCIIKICTAHNSQVLH